MRRGFFMLPPAYPITRNAILYWNNLCLCWNEIALSLLTGCALIRERASLQRNHFSKSVSGRSCNSNLLRKVLRGEIIFGRIWSVLQEEHNKTTERIFSHISLLYSRKSAFLWTNHNDILFAVRRWWARQLRFSNPCSTQLNWCLYFRYVIILIHRMKLYLYLRLVGTCFQTTG